MNKNMIGYLFGVLILSFSIGGLASITEPVEKEPVKEKVNYYTIDNVIKKYHPELLDRCYDFEQIVKNGDYRGPDRLYKGSPRSTNLSFGYSFKNDGDFVDVVISCDVKTTYFRNVTSQGTRTYSEEHGTYRFFKKYSDENPNDLINLVLVE